jgi:hypothetical protein
MIADYGPGEFKHLPKLQNITAGNKTIGHPAI